MIKFTKNYDVYPFENVTDDEGSVVSGYSETAKVIMANIQPKTKNLIVSPIGERIGATLTGFTELSIDIKEKDGVCIDSASKPDYYVSAVDVYRTHKVFELTRIGV